MNTTTTTKAGLKVNHYFIVRSISKPSRIRQWLEAAKNRIAAAGFATSDHPYLNEEHGSACVYAVDETFEGNLIASVKCHLITKKDARKNLVCNDKITKGIPTWR